LVSSLFLDAALSRRRALAVADGCARSILVAALSHGHPLNGNRIPAIRKLPRSDATISGSAELPGVADPTAAIVKQAVRRSARTAFLCAAQQA